MKKILVCAMLAVASIGFMNAQQVQNAIGIKFGDGGEISYQHALGSANRLEVNLGTHSLNWGGSTAGVRSNSVFLTGIYQWVWDLSQLADGFQWYAGVGAWCGLHTTRVTVAGNTTSDSSVSVAVVGNIGIEYNFDFPLQLALDWTPALTVTDGVQFGAEIFRLAARWRF